MSDGDDFFVGWAGRLPRRHAWHVRTVVLAAMVGIALLATALARGTDDPGEGHVDWAGGEQTLHGVATALPYPLLTLPSGHTVLLAGLGKSGVELDPALDGKPVTLSGFMVRRGSLDMLQATGAPMPDPAPGGARPVPRAVGTWRVTGEICDGKCEAGAMRPGNGIAHRACARLCLVGGVPPVLVTTAPLLGSSFLLLADAGGGPMPPSLQSKVALRVTLEGVVERRGDLLVLRVAE